MITIEDFDKVQICVGTVTSVSSNRKARKPAYQVTLDFDSKLGEKTSSAQLTELYQPEDLQKRLIFAKKYEKSTDFSVLLFVTSFLSCIDGGNGGTRTLDLTDVNRAL